MIETSGDAARRQGREGQGRGCGSCAERTKRVETVRETVRRDEIEIAHSDENERAPSKRTAHATADK
jgi:hypothetical protein